MDFGVLDGLVSSDNHNKNTLISCGDLDLKPKWFGSGGGFGKQESPISALATGTREDEWRDLKMAKIGEDDISRRSNGAQNMLSFSSPNTQTVTFPYYARHNTGTNSSFFFFPVSFTCTKPSFCWSFSCLWSEIRSSQSLIIRQFC